MRGRTNVGSGGGYIINGIKKECTVSGLPITKGDFVNVYNEPDGYLYLNTTEIPRAIGKITDKLYMFCSQAKVFVANINTKTILNSVDLQKEESVMAPPAFIGDNSMVYIDGKLSAYDISAGTGFSMSVRAMKVKYSVESNAFSFSYITDWQVFGSSNATKVIFKSKKAGLTSNVDNGRVAFGINYQTENTIRSTYALLNGDKLLKFGGQTSELYGCTSGIKLSGNSICSSTLLRASDSDYRTVITRYVISGDTITSQETKTLFNIYAVPLTFYNSQWQGIKVDALTDNNGNNSSILWSGLQNIETATTPTGIIPKYVANNSLAGGNFTLNNNIIKLSNSYVLYEHRTVEGNNVLSMLWFDSSGYHKAALDVTENTAITGCYAAAEYYESTNTFSLVYRGAYNSTDDPSNLLMRFMNTQMKDLSGGTNIVSLASDFRYIRGVANAYGEDGDTIQVIVSSLDTMEAITHDIREERTSFVIENDHLILEQEDYDPYQYSINDNGHLTVI